MITSLDTRMHSPYTSFYITKKGTHKEILQSLRKTVRSLQFQNKSIYKEYKQNLKQGFQNKILSYKLQSLILRKQEKSRVEKEKREKEKYDEEARRKSIRQKRLDRLSSRIYVVETLEDRASEVRKKGKFDRESMERIIQDREEKSYLELVDKRMKVAREKSEGRKRRDEKSVINEMRQREVYAGEMKLELEGIIQKEGVLEELEEELRQMELGKEGSVESNRLGNRERLRRSLEENYML